MSKWMSEHMNEWTYEHLLLVELKESQITSNERDAQKWKYCMSIDVLLPVAEGPGCAPSVHLSRECSPLKWISTRDSLTCESLLVWVEVIIAIIVITPRFQGRSNRCKDSLTVTRKAESPALSCTFSLMQCVFQKMNTFLSVLQYFWPERNRRELVNILTWFLLTL